MPATPPRALPSLARGLGYLALVPFVCGAVLAWLVDDGSRPIVAHALSAYAAVVIAFIGALHWGLAMRQVDPSPRLLLWGVVPSLVACAAVLQGPRLGLLVHACMLVVCYLVDRTAYPQQDVAAWLPLRFRLTIVATACCLVGAIGG